MFNSPLHYCPLCKQYVELDQTQQECALQHGCKVEPCPFTNLFKPEASTSEKTTDAQATTRKSG
jgi:hypothetical protein